MLSAPKTSLLILIIVLAQLLLAPQSQEQCAAGPSKNNIEKILGKPVECPSRVLERLCFRSNETTLVTVQFNSSDRAKNIFVSDGCRGIHELSKLTDELVPKSDRGKFLKQPKFSGTGSCKREYQDEYECLSMEYWEDNCRGCVPASVNILWK